MDTNEWKKTGIFAGVAVLAFGAFGGPVKAQQKPAPAKQPAAAAKKKAAQPAAKKARGKWVKHCDKAKGVKGDICLIQYEVLDEIGAVIAAAAIRKVEGIKKEDFLVSEPLGMRIPDGVRVTIDDGKHISLRFLFCNHNGCMAQAPGTESLGLVDKLKKGNNMLVAAINMAGKPVGYPVSLDGFTKVYQGPPIDKKVFQESQRKRVMMMRKRQQELLKRVREAQEKGKAGPKQPAPKKPQ